MQARKNKTKIFKTFTTQSPKHQKPKGKLSPNWPEPNEWSITIRRDIHFDINGIVSLQLSITMLRAEVENI